MKDVVGLTEQLFALSKETAQLEHETFVLKQKTALAAEVKATLDSWVRFEAQQRESEQADLVKSVQEKVIASLKDPKSQKDILAQAVADLDSASQRCHIGVLVADYLCSQTSSSQARFDCASDAKSPSKVSLLSLRQAGSNKAFRHYDIVLRAGADNVVAAAILSDAADYDTHRRASAARSTLESIGLPAHELGDSPTPF